jgi:hypothetical protein
MSVAYTVFGWILQLSIKRGNCKSTEPWDPKRASEFAGQPGQICGDEAAACCCWAHDASASACPWHAAKFTAASREREATTVIQEQNARYSRNVHPKSPHHPRPLVTWARIRPGIGGFTCLLLCVQAGRLGEIKNTT